jgi:spore cortex formation protein SpoVR/YcgB (stage V sporulation)
MSKDEVKKILDNSEWNEDTIITFSEIIDDISISHLGLDVYPNQFEIVTYEQLLDAYSLIGLPLSYDHWKFGRDFISNENMYKKGRMGLSYEMVINSNPCISYNLETNNTCLMTLVYAHVQGHNHYFKNNYLFKQWTHADSIIDYMIFAKNYIRNCELKYGYEEVELMLDSCHSLMEYGVDKYKKPSKISTIEEKERLSSKIDDDRILLTEIWKTLPQQNDNRITTQISFPEQPEENILYFIEKNSPKLKEWQREIIRIVRKISQYFYPQAQTKVLNEGIATFAHYEIINKMFDDDYLSDSFMLEFFHHHSNVIYQPDFDSKYYSGINPYTLGFNILKDVKRMSIDPTEEDKKWFPYIAGNKNWKETILYIVENFKDDTFIHQYLSPNVIRNMKLFTLNDDEKKDHYLVKHIHNDNGYKIIREQLSKQYNRSYYVPDIQIVNVDLFGDRKLTLKYTPLDNKGILNKEKVIPYIEYLWGYPVEII